MKNAPKKTTAAPASTTRQLTVSSVSNNSTHQYRRFPALRINGEWLRKLGFECGQQVTVTCSNGQLLVTPLKAPAVEWLAEEREYL